MKETGSLNAHQFIYNTANHFWAETVAQRTEEVGGLEKTIPREPWEHTEELSQFKLIPASAPALKLCGLKTHGKICFLQVIQLRSLCYKFEVAADMRVWPEIQEDFKLNL